MLKCVFFVRVEMSFLEEEDVVEFGKFFNISYNVMAARALNLGGGVVREGIEVMSDTGGRREEGGGGTARGEDRHWNQEKEVDFGER